MVEQHFCLRWNNYRNNITAEFETLREAEHFVDVTLSCDGRQLKAHKVVLSACSPYFKDLLQCNPCTHPIIILRDIAYSHMRSLLEFMYAGEVNVSQAHLGSFLSTAEALKVRGLADPSEDKKDVIGPRNCTASPASSHPSIGKLPPNFPSFHNPFLDPIMPSLIPHPSQVDFAHHPVSSHPCPIFPNPLSLPLSFPRSQFPLPISSSDGRIKVSPDRIRSISDSTQGSPLPLIVNREDSIHRKTDLETSAPSSKRLRPENKAPISISACSPLREKDSDNKLAENKSRNGCTVTPTTISTLPADEANKGKISQEHKTNSVGDSENNTKEDGTKSEPPDQPTSDPEVNDWIEDADTGSIRDRFLSPEAQNSNPGTVTSESDTTSLLFGEHTHQGTSEDSVSTTTNNSAITEIELKVTQTRKDEINVDQPYFNDFISSTQEFQRKDVPQQNIVSPPLPPSSLPHSCNLCGKLISCRRNLWKHMERVHFTNPAVRCLICTKMFKNKYALKDHQRIYHGGMSEPSQAHHLGQGNSSLLSKILKEPHHTQPYPHDLSFTPAHRFPPPPPISPSSPYYPLRRRNSDEINSRSIALNLSYNLGMATMLPPPAVPPLNMYISRPHAEWSPAQESPYALTTRSLLNDLHPREVQAKAD